MTASNIGDICFIVMPGTTMLHRKLDILIGRVDALFTVVNRTQQCDCLCNSHPALASRTDPEDPRNIFRCPFVSCLWSCKKCSAASGIHHMQSCICRPEDYHLQIVNRITSCFVKHPRLNDASKCCWCGLIMGGLSRDQRSKHRNDCIKVGVHPLLSQLY